MSVSYDAKFMVGVPWDAVVKEIPTTVTKYHTDTGVPYQVAVIDPPVTALGQKFDDADTAQSWLEKHVKLDVEVAGYSGDRDRMKFVGVVLTTVDTRNPVADIPMTKLAVAVDAVTHTLKAYGYDGPNPALIHMLRFG